MDRPSAIVETEFRVKESLQEFLDRHTADCVYKSFNSRHQNVEIVRSESQGHRMVIDSPEYDFMFHRLSYLVQVNSLMPLAGFVQLQWPSLDPEGKTKYEAAHFHANSSFGDALEKVQVLIWKRIEE
ncbi:MAG: hypothetical protein ACHQX3_00540 [Nitrospirales bacterium]|jgi:hypothetical protein